MTVIKAARIKQHKIVFRKRRSFGYAVSLFCRLFSKDAEKPIDGRCKFDRDLKNDC